MLLGCVESAVDNHIFSLPEGSLTYSKMDGAGEDRSVSHEVVSVFTCVFGYRDRLPQLARGVPFTDPDHKSTLLFYPQKGGSKHGWKKAGNWCHP
jgi:hypothetical protein